MDLATLQTYAPTAGLVGLIVFGLALLWANRDGILAKLLNGLEIDRPENLDDLAPPPGPIVIDTAAADDLAEGLMAVLTIRRLFRTTDRADLVADFDRQTLPNILAALDDLDDLAEAEAEAAELSPIFADDDDDNPQPTPTAPEAPNA